MSIDFLPESFTRVTVHELVVPVKDVPDLADPSTGRIAIPAFVELHLRRNEGTPKGDREYAYVSVTGPRRLKSGAAGKQISSFGWERTRNDGRHGYVDRPDWLTTVLADLLPWGWPHSLVELPGGAS